MKIKNSYLSIGILIFFLVMFGIMGLFPESFISIILSYILVSIFCLLGLFIFYLIILSLLKSIRDND